MSTARGLGIDVPSPSCLLTKVPGGTCCKIYKRLQIAPTLPVTGNTMPVM
jgi:hypothetical protein